MELNQEDIEKRLPVWRALSDLFLDTELDQSDLQYIANRIRESGYTRQEVQEILWDEVFPALGDNLRITTGEWACFSDAWLQERIMGVMNGTEQALGNYGLISVTQARQIVSEVWKEVLVLLHGD